MAKMKLKCPDCSGFVKKSSDGVCHCDKCNKDVNKKDCAKDTMEPALQCPNCNSGTVIPNEVQEDKGVCDSCGASVKLSDCKQRDEGEYEDPEEIGEDGFSKKKVTVNDSMLWSMSPSDAQTAKDMGLIEPFRATQDGFLKGRTVGTTIGVYTYKNADGTVSRRLRLPEEVFADDSVKSLRMVPVCNTHPTELVTPENSKKYSVGSVGDVMQDAYRLYPSLCITDADALQAIREGRRFLSCGYTADIEDKSGVWNGVAYDQIQRNIRYNHIALVDSPRAGDEAVMHFDGLEIENPSKENTHMAMKTIVLDGKEYQADEALAGIVAKFQADSKDSAEKIVKLEAERDTFKAQADKLAVDSKDVEAKLPALVLEGVKTRLALVDAAAKFGAEIKAEMTDGEIRKICLTKFNPAISLDGKDDAYLTVAFDVACGMVEAGAKFTGKVALKDGEFKPERTAEQARVEMAQRMEKQSRGEAI